MVLKANKYGVDRYSFDSYTNDICRFSNGGYVKHEDYERLENAFNELVTFIDNTPCISVGAGRIYNKACQIQEELNQSEQIQNQRDSA